MTSLYVNYFYPFIRSRFKFLKDKNLPFHIGLKHSFNQYSTQDNVPRSRLGRPSNHLKIGVVGLPNIGKSTFFNSVTNSSVPAENFPFCTIDPSEARVAVPDSRFDWLCEYYKPKSRVPAYLTVIDIAGLVQGAASGAGLGNSFLNHVRSVDALYHLCRSYEDNDIQHVEGNVNPIRDLEIIHAELRIKDMEFLTKHIEVLSRGSNRADTKKKEELAIVTKILSWVEDQEMDVRKGAWSNEEIEIINNLHLITAKPMIYLANLSDGDYASGKNKWIPQIKAWIDKNNPGDLLIPFSASLESAISMLEPEEQKEELDSLGVTSALPQIVTSGYKALELSHYFTAGEDEVRAWTIQAGCKAPQAAGVIHSDFERGFIAAEVMKFQDLKECGSESVVKSSGKLVQKGKDYVVEDGDIIFFKFHVGKNKSKK